MNDGIADVTEVMVTDPVGPVLNGMLDVLETLLGDCVDLNLVEILGLCGVEIAAEVSLTDVVKDG